MELKRCQKCGEDKELSKFPKQRKNPERRTSPCLRCRDRKRLSNPDSCINATILRKRTRYLSRVENVPSIVTRTAKRSDKKHGRIGFDLDSEYVSILMSEGCRYCGTQSVRMTLDRIDNSLAHTKANVVPACVRCNNIRGSMPYEAWTLLVPSVKEAYVRGLFGNWWSDTKSLFKPRTAQATSCSESSPKKEEQ